MRQRVFDRFEVRRQVAEQHDRPDVGLYLFHHIMTALHRPYTGYQHMQ